MAKIKLSPLELIIHNQFTCYGRNAREWTRKCAVLLPKVEQHQIWRKRRCHSIYEYAAKVAGMSRSAVDQALWVLEKIKDKPELLKVVEEKGIQAVRPIANLATQATAKFWAENAMITSKHGLEALAREYRKSCPGARTESGKMQKTVGEAITQTVSFELSSNLARRLDRIRKRKNFEQLLTKFVEGIEQEEESRKPEAVETDSRPVPAAIERFSRERTGDKCAFPCCMKPIFQLHHTQRWALHHIHDPDKLWGLCQAHNELAHLGLIENEEGRPETWRLKNKEEVQFAEQAGPALWSAKYLVDQRVQQFRANAMTCAFV